MSYDRTYKQTDKRTEITTLYKDDYVDLISPVTTPQDNNTNMYITYNSNCKHCSLQ